MLGLLSLVSNLVGLLGRSLLFVLVSLSLFCPFSEACLGYRAVVFNLDCMGYCMDFSHPR